MWTGAKTEFRKQLTAISNFIKTEKRYKNHILRGQYYFPFATT